MGRKKCSYAFSYLRNNKEFYMDVNIMQKCEELPFRFKDCLTREGHTDYYRKFIYQRSMRFEVKFPVVELKLDM